MAHVAANHAALQQRIAERCRGEEESARKALHPDAEMIARHDQLMAQSARYDTEAEKATDAAARKTALGNAVQARIEAEAIYDWQRAQSYASDCWRELNIVADIHNQSEREIAASAAAMAASASTPAPSSWRPSMPPAAELRAAVQPPPPPSPMPLPNLGGKPCGPTATDCGAGTDYVPPRQKLPDSPALPGPYLGRVPGGPDVYGVPADQIAPPPPLPLVR
jgi:hypothetical protein